MNTDRLLALYDRVADAPDAIARLRRFVLDLAVRGKLVAQDPIDEPASELLKQIATEKARLIEAGEIKKPRDLAVSDDPQPPFDIPATWRWCRLDAVGAVIGGGTPSADHPQNFAERGAGIPWLTPADLGGCRDLFIERGARDLSEVGLASSSATMMPAGTVLFTSRAPIGYVAIAANPISTNQGFKSVVPYVADSSRFIALVMQTFAPQIDAQAPGTTFKEVSGKIVAGVPFPLPPFAEQRRIVAKVDELMALLDRLGAAHTAREAARNRLADVNLARLTALKGESADLADNAGYFLATLPALTTRLDQIKALRQAIINLAVRGKLVEQDSTGEQVDLLQSDDVDSPETLPTGWRFARLDSLLAENTRNGLSRRPDDAENGVPILRISAGTARQDGIVAEEEHKLISGIDHATRLQYGLQRGDLLACRFNGNKAFVGRLTLFNDYLKLSPIYPDKLIRVRLDRRIASPEFICMAGESDCVRKKIAEFCATTVGNWGISASNLKEVPFPLPPLAEQRRIVAKVGELMGLCQRLETALSTADTTRARLLEALLCEALAPVPMPQAA